MRSGFYFKVLFIFILFGITLAGANAIKGGNGPMGFAILAPYVEEENGIQLYAQDENGEAVKDKKLNLGRFFHDIFKGGQDPVILQECAEFADDASFAECVDTRVAEDDYVQGQYESQMNNIEEAIAFGESHGMQYMDVPFIRDFVRG